MYYMSILADFQYGLNDYMNIKNNSTINELDQYTIKNINKIAAKVGAPSYIRTPVFKKKRQYKKEKKYIEKGENVKEFKQTVLKKNIDGIEVQLDKIITYLNKLTNKNYDENLENIIFIMKLVEKEEKSYLKKICNSIFEIGGRNKFWSHIYAKLCNDIISEFPNMKEICLENFLNFNSLFKEIRFIESNINYNLFCEYNKENEKRRSLSKFFVLLSNYDIIDKNHILSILENFIKNIKISISLSNELIKIEEITENVKIIIENFNDEYKNLKNYEEIKKEIEFISELDTKDYQSLNNKVIFNFLDIFDMM